MADEYRVYRTVAGMGRLNQQAHLHHTLMMTTPYKHCAVSFAKLCASPIQNPDYVQSMTVIGPNGETEDHLACYVATESEA